MTAPPLESPSSINIRRELFRKSLHLPGMLVPFASRYSLVATVSVLAALCLLYLLSETFRLKQRNALPVFGPLGATLTRRSGLDWAPVFLAVGLGLAALFFPFRAALAGTLLVCVSDGFAALVGMNWGRKKLPWGTKTYLGSAAFFISAVLLLLIFLPWQTALLVAVAGTLLESISARGLDNLLLPIVGAAVAQYL